MLSATLKKLGFTRSVVVSRPDHIFLVRGRDAAGERAWYYVMVEKGKRDAFKAQEGVPFLKLTDYGEVLYSGFGENPPEAVRKQMEDEYGFRE